MLRRAGAVALLALACPLLASAAFPGANAKVAFSAFDGGDRDVIAANPDGTGIVNLTAASSDEDSAPSFSPDGTRVAFVSDRDGNEELYRMDADGSSLVRLTNDAAADTHPAWSPDGTKLAFASDRDGDLDIWTMNADGTGLANLTGASALAERQPAWSPGGTTIAFLRGSEVVLIPAAGGAETILASEGIASLDSVDWLPDGLRVIYGRYISFPPQLVVRNADGSGTPVTYDGEGNGAEWPAVSPDGTRIVFVQTGTARVVPASFSSPSTAVTSSAAAASGTTWGATPPAPAPAPAPPPPTPPAPAPDPEPEPEPESALILHGSFVSAASVGRVTGALGLPAAAVARGPRIVLRTGIALAPANARP